MAFKLRIRRTFPLLPTLCLAGVLGFGFLFFWLCRFGVPNGVIHIVENAAQEQGITLRMRALTLDPRAGLALSARGLKLSYPQKEAPPLYLEANRFVVSFSLTKLAEGDYLPIRISLRDAYVNVPLNAEEKFHANNISFEADLRKRHAQYITLSGNLQGVDVDLRALIDPAKLPQSEEPDEAETLDFEAMSAQYRPKLVQICRSIVQQHWKAPHTPRLNVRLTCTETEPRCRIIGTVPSYDYQSLHFRDIRLDALYADNRLTVNPTGFKTIDPDSEVTVSGLYDFAHRTAEIQLDSTADVLGISRVALGEEATRAISEKYISAPKAPHISLQGKAALTENYQLQSITIDGALHQEGLHLGHTETKNLDLEFFFDNGNLNLSKCELEWPDGGKLGISGILKDGSGKAEVNVSAPVQAALGLVEDLSNGSFTAPEEISLDGMLNTRLIIRVDAAPFVPGETQPEELIPTLREIHCSVAVEKAGFDTHQADKPVLQIDCSGIDYNEQQLTIQESSLSLAADAFSALLGDKPLQATEFGASLHAANIVVPLSDRSPAPRIGSLSAMLAAQALRYDQTALEKPVFSLRDTGELTLDSEKPALPSRFAIEVSVDKLTQGEHLTVTEAALELNHGDNDTLKLSAKMNGEDVGCTLRGKTLGAGGRPTGLHVDEASAEFRLATIEDFLVEMGCGTDMVRFPEVVLVDNVSGDVSWAPFSLNDVHLSLSLPELVRTPQHPMLKGHDVAVSIDTDVNIRTDEAGHLLYGGTAAIVHNPKTHMPGAPGEIQLAFSSPTPDSVHVQGRSTITADTADALIDDADAHSILRDFRFNADSRVTADDINVLVDWSNGVAVSVSCKGDIRNTQLLLLGTEEKTDADGKVIAEEMSKQWGPDPLATVKQATCGVEVILQYDMKDKNGKPIPDVQRVNLTDPVLCYDNRPWLRRNRFKDGTAESTVRGKGVYFDLEKNTLTLSELSGTCYPAYSFGMFFPDLMRFMETIILPKPVAVSTHQCVFPLAHSCTEPMSGTIRAISDNGAALRFLGTDIPLREFSGFVTLTDTEVKLSRMNALTWGGVVNADVNINFAGKHTGFDGIVSADNLDLHAISEAYKLNFSPAIVNARLRFRTPSADVNALRGYGYAQIIGGNLEELNIFRPVTSLLSYATTHIDDLLSKDKEYVQNAINNTFDKVINTYQRGTTYIPFISHVALDYNIANLDAPLRISGGRLITTNARATGRNLALDINGSLGLNKLEWDLDIGARINVILPKLSKLRFNIAVTCPLQKPQARTYIRLLDTKKKSGGD